MDDTVTTGGGRNDGLTWPVDAWIEVDGTVHGRHPVTRELLRIGREDDNDIVLPLQTVHRYHAVIQRTDDAEIVVMDLSSRQGNGVVVNGKRISRQRLANGDIIQLGESRLTYSARRV